MKLALLGRNKIGFVNGKCKKENYPESLWDQWERVNAIVLSWLMNVVDIHQIGGIIYATDSQALWDDLKERFEKIDDQGCNCDKSKEFVQYVHRQKLYQFLMGLNESYSQARSHILLQNSLPSVNQAYSMILSDENQRAITSSNNSLWFTWFKFW
ncbi:uncharacterized protein LOC132031724 [Lycium ferocissimum]|uniref:uncharacterized protein LOC132031724 n=1 Tax=Lycium ferocissimum TaxID=112874 RepID=UPI002815442D|nr:uncharacterized protein LOC132031724 [Lycium ferocissimum]